MSITSNFPPQDKKELYDRLSMTNQDVKRKGKTSPYTSHNGHMFSYLYKNGSSGLRLPKNEGEAFLEKQNTTLFKSYGVIMK